MKRALIWTECHLWGVALLFLMVPLALAACVYEWIRGK